MSELTTATSGQKKVKKQRRVKNLVCRGGIYYVRRKVGSRIIRVSTKQKDLKLAEVAAREILSRIDKGEVDEFIGKKKAVDKPTYGEYVQTYYTNVSALKKVPRIDHEFIEPTREAWASKRIDKITPDDCLAFLASMKLEDRSQNSVRTMMVLSSCVFNRAIASGILSKNPWREVPRASKPKRKPRTRVITPAEQDAFMEAMKDQELKRLTRILIGSGLRIGEALAVTPKDNLDFANKFIRLSGSMTKSGKPRSVPMFPDVESALIEQLAWRDRKMDDARPLFPLMPQRSVNKAFVKAWTRAKIARVTPHDCRRTFGTRMASDGVPMKVLQMWMGHATIEMTAEFYVHADDSTSTHVAQQVAAKQAGGKVVSITKAK